MPKFECQAHVQSRRREQETLQPFDIRTEVRRQLEKHRAKSARAFGGQQRSFESSDGTITIAQTLQMRDRLRRLERESKAFGCRVKPCFQLLFRRQLPEGEVHFHRVQL